jgi:phage terminase large subunit-like protein
VTRAEIVVRLTNDKGQRLRPLPWWTRMAEALADPAIRIVLIQAIRQVGKTTAGLARAIEDLLLVPGSFTLFVSAGREQAEELFRRKCRRPLERLLRAAGLPSSTIRVTKTMAENPALGSALEIITPSEVTTPGRSVSLLIIDEARYVSDQVFATLAPSTIGARGKILILSTAGRPAGFFHALATRPDREVAVIRVDANENPSADQEMIGFLGRLLQRLLPVTAKRDLENVFAEDGERFIEAAVWDACVEPSWSPLWSTHEPSLFVGIDAATRDDTCAGVGVIRDEDHIILACHRIWRPSRETPLDLREVEDWVLQLHRQYRLARVLVDPYQMARSIAALRAVGVPIEEHVQTPANLTRMAQVLFELLQSQALVLYPSDELREQALNAVVADTVRGLKLAKERASGKIDSLIALSMAAVAAVDQPVLPPLIFR